MAPVLPIKYRNIIHKAASNVKQGNTEDDATTYIDTKSINLISMENSYVQFKVNYVIEVGKLPSCITDEINGMNLC